MVEVLCVVQLVQLPYSTHALACVVAFVARCCMCPCDLPHKLLSSSSPALCFGSAESSSDEVVCLFNHLV